MSGDTPAGDSVAKCEGDTRRMDRCRDLRAHSSALILVERRRETGGRFRERACEQTHDGANVAPVLLVLFFFESKS